MKPKKLRQELGRLGIELTLLTFLIGLFCTAALAQTSNNSNDSQEDSEREIEEIVVSGSRLPSGFTTPTPVTVITSEQLNDVAPGNLADGLTQLPMLKGSASSNRARNGSVNGFLAQNLLDLRQMGTVRTLILVDGRRMVHSSAVRGGVDINLIPQDLVQRVDIVTGGASAAYGSDAVSGAVNFILDKSFRGVKGTLQGGISGYGDAPSGKANIAIGTGFANDRGRLIVSGEYFRQGRIGVYESGGRDWLDNPAGRIPNTPSDALPSQIVAFDVDSSISSWGGLITGGPLRGTSFLPGGVPYEFDYGTVTASSFQVGGDGANSLAASLTPSQKRATAFMHTEFDVTDKFTVFLEGNYSKSHNVLEAFYNFSLGGNFGLTIFRDNAFLPTSIRDKMIELDLESFPMGRSHADMPPQHVDADNELKRFVIGFKGEFENGWRYDAYFNRGESRQIHAATNFSILRNLFAAVDAVVDPATGRIVCRSTLSGFDPGCVPMNVFGEGSVTDKVVDYVQGSSVRDVTLTEEVYAFNISGTLGDRFSFGGRPMTAAAGIEYRTEAAVQTADDISTGVTDFTGIRGGTTALQGRAGGFPFFNPVPLEGDYDITEGYLEIGAPLISDAPGVELLDLNAGVRRSDYSSSGAVTTWKVGLTYRPGQDFLLRATQSKDIRGPNINELFNPATLNSSFVLVNNVPTAYTGFRSGNPNVSPEDADTTTLGIVYSPSYLEGLSVSADYYKIDLSGAIGGLSAQQTVDQCAAGSQVACDQIEEVGDALRISFPSLNLSFIKTSGIDLEAAYAVDLAGGELSLRSLINYTHEFVSKTPGADAQDRVGEVGPATQPEFSGLLRANYRRGPYSFVLQERFIGPGKIDATWEEGIQISENDVSSVFYTDFAARLRLDAFEGESELFLSINNVFDKEPPVVPFPASTFQYPTNADLYPTIGRYFTAGVRFSF